MKQSLRRLTPVGMAQLREYLADLRRDGACPVPLKMLDDPILSEEAFPAVQLSRPGFATKRAAAVYLDEKLAPLGDRSNLLLDSGLWSWLALYYFDDVCPVGSNGKRAPLAEPHYVLDANNSRRRYRHLLATPFKIIGDLAVHNRILLDLPLTTHGDLTEQVMGRLYLLRPPSVQALIDRLYFDPVRGRAKPGIISKKAKPGDLRNRLTIRLRQLLVTYDVAGMACDDLLELLGDEFKVWDTTIPEGGQGKSA